MSKQAKFVWARSLFKTIKKKYPKINRIKDIKNLTKFLASGGSTQEFLQIPKPQVIQRKKYLFTATSKKKRRYFLLKTTTPFQKYTLSHKNKLFYFLITKKRKQDKLENIKENKISGALKKSTRSHYRNLSFVRINFNKFKRLFVLKKFRYNFSCFGLHKSFINDFTSKDTIIS